MQLETLKLESGFLCTTYLLVGLRTFWPKMIESIRNIKNFIIVINL